MSESLPHGWALPTIDDVCDSVSKRGPDTERPTFRYIDLGAIDNKSKTIAEVGELPVKGAPSRARQIVRTGDVVFSNVRVYLENIAQVPVELAGEVASTAFCVLRPKAGIEPRYLYYYVTSKPFIRTVDGLQRGNSPPSVQDGDVKSQSIPVAPTPEQKRIVSKIDELFSRIDEGERALERVSKLVERYRLSALKAAVTGELTRDWREARKAAGQPIETGEALLARILTARRKAWEQAELAKMQAKGIKPKDDAWKKKYKEPASPDTTDLPRLTSGWVWTSLAQMKSFSLYGPRFSSEDYDEDGYLVLRTSDISKAGRVNVESAPKLKLSDKAFAKYRVEKGDLLVTRTGSLGTLALFDDDVDAIPGAYLIQFRLPAPNITRWYLFHFFKSPVGQAQLLAGGAGVGRPNLNAPSIEAIPIPLPPLEEQHVIVDRIEATLESLSKQTEQMRRDAQASSALRQSVLHKAFSGGLVQQSPNDEPATNLLQRIAAERVEHNTAAPKRSRKKKFA